MPESLPDDLLAKPVTGLNLGGNTLSEAFGAKPTLVSFLRHFG